MALSDVYKRQALSYEGKVVYFDWFHFLTDGRGIAPFMTMVLQFYCNLRYGTAFEGSTRMSS